MYIWLKDNTMQLYYLFCQIKGYLQNLWEVYDIKDEIIYIKLIFRQIDYKFLSDIYLNKDKFKRKE